MSTRPNRAISSYTQSSASSARVNRDEMVETHLSQVKFIAERLSAKLPPSVDIDDLMGAGMLGLLDAVDKFDPAKGVMFRTYAEMRVRGAMLDSLRDLDWAPRSMRRRAREIEAAYVEVERTRGRATDADVASMLGIGVNEFQTLLGQLRGLTVTALDAIEDEDNGHSQPLAGDASQTPLALYERNEITTCLADAIDRLPNRERQVVALYYVEELTMKEIGAVLNVTESRVSQIHTQAIVRLRASLAVLRDSLAIAQ
ncbi:MAG TPA: FliA/WhiG family RNA polymerase sigma factor [Pyrinomonadaceae bacterium]